MKYFPKGTREGITTNGRPTLAKPSFKELSLKQISPAEALLFERNPYPYLDHPKSTFENLYILK